MDDEQEQDVRGRAARIGLYLGPGLALVMMVFFEPSSMEGVAWRTAAIAIWMAVWWATEAIPVPATALLPLMLFAPFEILSIRETAASFAHPTIFLFLGGFILAAAIEKWNLHRRLALNVLMRVGTGPARLVGGFMLVSALLSMWMTNTSTTMMLLPIAISIVSLMLSEGGDVSERSEQNFKISMLLGVAYGATIGGVATLIGTPPNAFLAGFMAETYDISIGFSDWMKVGLPITFIMLPGAWFVLTRFIYPAEFSASENVSSHFESLRQNLGRMSGAEVRVGLVFLLVALSWMFRKVIIGVTGIEGLSDAGIAITGAILLFLLPSGRARSERLMDWSSAIVVPWGILLLFGGGLALANAVSQSGLASWLGNSLAPLGDFGLPVLLVATVALVIFLTELTSNLATTASFLPVVSAVAVELGVDPMLLAVPVALAASCAFMLPVATPPNAIVFGSGFLTIPQMARAGLWLNCFAIVLLALVALFLVPMVFG